jgi:hypothetical protein
VKESVAWYRRLAAWLRWVLADRRIVAWTILATAVLCSHVLSQGYLADDHALRGLVQRLPPWDRWSRSQLELFTFYDGDEARTHSLVDIGFSPWWTEPTLRVMFLRPLTALTHWVDFHIDSPVFAHAVSLGLYLGVIAVVARLYHRILGRTWVAGFAVVTFAWDNNHAVLVEWIANRNALVAGLFGVLAIVFHDRRAGARSALLSAVCLALALAGGEQALGAVAFLAAHACFLDERPIRARVVSLAPQLAVLFAWFVLYRLGHYGAHGSGVYIDPADTPLAFLRAAAANIPLMLQSELGGFPSDILVILPSIPPAAFVVSGVLIGVTAVALTPLHGDRRARFFLAGALLAIIPSAATFPSGRLLLFPSIGLLALLALVVEGVVDGTVAWRPGPMRWAAVFTAAWMGGRHLFLSPLTIHLPLRQMALLEQVLAGYGEGLGDDPALSHQRVIVVNPADAFFTYYVASMRLTQGRVMPERILVLTGGKRPLEIERTDAHTLVVRQDAGFFRSGTEILTRSPSMPMKAGTRVQLTGVSVEVARDDGSVPTEAVFRFDAALESPTLKWLEWRGKTFVPFELPAIGTTRQIQAQMPSL